MSLPIQFPYYGPLGSGPYNVSLAIPGPTSEISKSIGLNTPTGLLLPNTDYIKKFVEGDLGISDSFIKDMLYKNINSKESSSNEEVFRKFAKLNKIEIGDISKYKKGNKFILPKSEIKVPKEFDMTGFKAFEKTALQTIFETQKPYMEIIKTVIEGISKSEDIIARVMPLLSTNPLVAKSRVPSKNEGSGKSRPKAIGYKGGEELKKELRTIEQLRQKVDKVTPNKPSSNLSNPNNITFSPLTESGNTGGLLNKNWEIVSIVYSTGIFDPNIDYVFKYIDIVDEEIIPHVPESDIDLDVEDPFEKYKPKKMIFGIYNSKGIAINPNELISKTVTVGNNKIEQKTQFKRADWLLRSPKWKLGNGVFEWPSLGTPNFIWVNNLGNTKISKERPSGYTLKKYKRNDKNILTGQPAIEGDPVISSFDNIESVSLTNHFNDLIDIGLQKDDTITSEEKSLISSDIMSRIDMKTQLETIFLYGQMKSSVYKKVNNKDVFPELLRKSFKPYEIFSQEAANDDVLRRTALSKGKTPGMIWVDPEMDYDLKIIRIDAEPKFTISSNVNPIQITNDHLITSDLFIKEPDFYGHGTDDRPQTIGVIKRHALTDLDTEPYYVIEGVLRSENIFETDESGNRVDGGRGKNGKTWYRLPDAIGAIRVFANFLISIMTKLIPNIRKLLTLFKNPTSFITDIMAEKLEKNFEFLSKESLLTFKKAVELRDKIKTQESGIDNINDEINTVVLSAKNRADSLVNNAPPSGKEEAKKEASKIQQDANRRVENLRKRANKKKELVNRLRDMFKDSTLSNYVYVDDSLELIFTLGGSSIIPFSIFGKDLSFGASLEMNNVPKKPPVKLIFPSGIFQNFKNVQFLFSKKPNNTPTLSPSLSDIISNQQIGLTNPVKDIVKDKSTPFTNNPINDSESNTVQIKFQDGTTRQIPSDTLDDFVSKNSNRYDFIYVTEEINKLIKEVDFLIESGTPEDLSIAKEKLELAKSKNSINRLKGDSDAINDKIKEVNDKNNRLSRNTQPLIKLLLGFTTFPIKIVSGIIKWIMDFFLSITNPMTLPSKMKEFLSFKWILQFFTPTGILEIFGLKFKPAILPTFSLGGMADLSQFINLGFISTLPTYTPLQYKSLIKGKQPLRFLSIFKMMEKFINAVIDFIWSLLGIEALIPAPHINMSSSQISDIIKSEDLSKIVSGIEPSGYTTPKVSDGLNSDGNTKQLNEGVQGFVYEVMLPDGRIVTYLNRDELDRFIQENKDINFDFTFD